MLNSLTIKNFRSLEDFQVNKLGRVNLIVGKNNSGKSSVLEALRIYAGNANQGLLEKVAKGHDEKYYLDNYEQEGIDRSLPYEDLFTGRKFPTDENPIVIGEIDNVKAALTIDHVYLVEKDVNVTDDAGKTSSIKRQESVTLRSLSEHSQVVGDGLLMRKEGNATVIDFNKIGPDFKRFVTVGSPLSCSFIPTQLIAMNELAKDWDAIALTEAEETVKTAMKIILPEFENLIFVNDSTYGESKAIRRIAKVKIKGLSHPVPLNSLGDGMLRILQLVLKIFPAKGGFFLIDEFENGLHYGVQEKVWRLLFDLSIKLDIQIFATTHSWDCIESFAKVAVDKKDIEGVLFRVGQSVRTSDTGRVIATVFDEEQLYNITQSDVEVR
jgi:AAA15 family ATPase/GTPase